MKKPMIAIVLCLLLLCMAACGNNRQRNGMQFSNSEEMLNFLQGMWAVTDGTSENTYYIFQDNQLYIAKDTTYSEQVEKQLDSALQNGGLDSLYAQNFKLVSDRMYLGDLATTPNSVNLFSDRGEIEVYEGVYDKKAFS